jgi:hypothetical protein
MPFRSLRTLEVWLEEFRADGHPIGDGIRVMTQDGDGGANTGLVGVRLVNASTSMYIQPAEPGAVTWVVTMEPRESPITLDADGVRALADELGVVSRLCRFLESKSAAFVEPDSP